MRRMSLLLLVAAVSMVVSALPAGAAPSNSPNSTGDIELLCENDDTEEVVVIKVFAIWNSSGGSYFTADADGRQYVASWYEITYSDSEVVFEKSYGERKGFSNSLTCDAGTFDDDDGLGPYTVEVGLKSK